jgi:hypothetical protein
MLVSLVVVLLMLSLRGLVLVVVMVMSERKVVSGEWFVVGCGGSEGASA